MAWLYIILILLLSIWFYNAIIRKHTLPGIPGPKRIPIFGNLFQLVSSGQHRQFTEWSKEYGPVFALDLAGKQAVVVSGKEALYEVLVRRGKEYAGRLQTFRSVQICSDAGLVFSDLTPIISHEKKLIMSHLKAYGPGFDNLEKVVMREMESLNRKLRNACNGGISAISLDKYIEDCVAEISCILTMGRETEKDEATKLMGLLTTLNECLNDGFFGQSLDLMPWLRYFGHPYWKMIRRSVIEIDNRYKEWKQRVYQDREQGKDMSASYLHKYLEIYEGANELGIQEYNCKYSILSIFGSAVNTTSKTLNALLANVILHPNVQHKLQTECDRILHGRHVVVKDRFNMPYHHAVVLETTRLFPIAPIAFPHKAFCHSEITGYKIPKGTIVFPNIWALQHDEDLWDKPMEFNPDRYLDDDGKLVPADHPARVNHLTFSAGPRVCPGETMATARMFLILATLIQNFELLPATTLNEQPRCGCLNMIDGAIITPPPYKARLKPRVEM